MKKNIMFHLHPKTIRRIVAAATLGLLLLMVVVYSGITTKASAATVSAAALTSRNALVNVVPAYTLAAKNIKATSGRAFTKVVATGTDPFPNDTLTGTINWGDNTTPTSVQVVSSAKGTCQVKATHTYSQPGNYTITVSLTSYIVGPITQTGTATALAQLVIF